ncbi:PASTA domain-containing protein [Thermophagus sp. OGC60D27]|uniref:PASTA domain-containing protein n=1 Tax=Thermophagus sp. OGC60D27 TaxID=3458415 RepID=UPI0040378B1E
MSIVKAIFSKDFAKHFAIVIVSGFILLGLIFWGLSLYTRHGQSLETPDFTGLTEEQFKHLIETHELRYDIIDSVYINDEPPGIVIEQTPEPGSLIKKNRKIFFTINAWAAENVRMPDLHDYSVRNARVLLESFGLKIGKLIYVPSEYTNLVLGQHYQGKPVEPGTPLEKGSSVDLLIGKGLSDQTTSVPDLTGLTLEEALGTCHNLSLNIGAQIYDTTVVSKQDSLAAFVWKQRPESLPQNQLRLGASIDIWLSTDSSFIIPDSTQTLYLNENDFSNEQEDFDTEEEKFY